MPINTDLLITAEQKASAERARIHREIDAERDRRIHAGTTVTVSGYGDVPIQGRDVDQVNLLALKDTARDLQAAGIVDPLIPFRDAVNTNHMLTAQQMIAIVDAGKARVTAIYQAAWDLKAMDPLPADVTADELWPE